LKLFIKLFEFLEEKCLLMFINNTGYRYNKSVKEVTKTYVLFKIAAAPCHTSGF